MFNRFREATGLAVMEGFGQTETTVVLGNFVGCNLYRWSTLPVEKK